MNPQPDGGIAAAASELAETVVLEALLTKAIAISDQYPGVPVHAIAAALSYSLRAALSAPTATLILDAEAKQAGHRSRVRAQVAQLTGSHRQVIERFYDLAGAVNAREVAGEQAGRG